MFLFHNSSVPFLFCISSLHYICYWSWRPPVVCTLDSAQLLLYSGGGLEVFDNTSLSAPHHGLFSRSPDPSEWLHWRLLWPATTQWYGQVDNILYSVWTFWNCLTSVKATITHYNQEMQNTIPECTAHQILKQMGYSSRRPVHVSLMSAHSKVRLQLAHSHQNWTSEDWKKWWKTDGGVMVWGVFSWPLLWAP